MITNEMSIVIHHRGDRVFAYIADQRSNPKWQSGLVAIWQSPESPVGLGT